jgi:hypothetical protein
MTRKNNKEEKIETAKRESRATGVATPPLEEVAYRRYQDSISRHLSKIQAIEAVFIFTDEDLVHVYAVVPEYNSEIYEKLLKQERLIQREFPETRFDFHARAHQGRRPSLAVPFGSQAVFVRR